MIMNLCPYTTSREHGFTLIELVMIIVILGILSATVYVRWPVGMEEDAAAKELRRAIRYAQHKAMTRQYDDTSPESAWGIIIASPNRYTLQRQNANCLLAADAADPDKCAEEEYRERALNDDSTMTLTGGPVWFNALGEPIDADGSITGTAGTPLPVGPTLSFTVAGTKPVVVSPKTGYVQ
ncbi:MAG: type II secretion system GspH family protein [Proteobacteria bacterium]|nr:type II secretion system GspH family protein [Pseudomonadota bacterium]